MPQEASTFEPFQFKIPFFPGPTIRSTWPVDSMPPQHTPFLMFGGLTFLEFSQPTFPTMFRPVGKKWLWADHYPLGHVKVVPSLANKLCLLAVAIRIFKKVARILLVLNGIPTSSTLWQACLSPLDHARHQDSILCLCQISIRFPPTSHLRSFSH